MKKVMLSIAVLSAISFAACNNATDETTTDADSMTVTQTTEPVDLNGNYTDLTTGQTVTLKRDPQTGYITDATSGQPVEFYVDMGTMDTFYGRTGTVVNHAILHTTEGSYKLDDTKVEWDGDELKMKSDNAKMKVDGDEYKYKDENTKVKMDGDESKIKKGDVKIKTEDGETKIKTD